MRTLIAIITLAVGVPNLHAQAPVEAITVGVGQQTTLTPGFAIGDVNAVNSSIADFVVARGRRQVTILGLTRGSASVALWDQAGRHRLDLTIAVVRKIGGDMVEQLRAAVAPYTEVNLLTLRGETVLSGQVSTTEDLQLVRGLAASAGVECLVSVRTPVRPTDPARQTPFTVEYDLRLIEAEAHFTTQPYDAGVEPSGRELYRTTLTATSDATAQGFIGGGATLRSRQKNDKQVAAPETGLRISLTPRHGPAGAADTEVLVETNLPIASKVYVPTEWRRFRRTFTTRLAAPFAVAGNDLVAAPAPDSTGSKLKNAGRWVARIVGLPGVSGVKGVGGIPVFANLIGSEPYQKGQTQLVLVVRPRLVATAVE